MSKKFGLALGSGAWRGLAHIGVLKSLSQNKIPVNFIAGSSIGSIIGGLYAALNNVDELEKIANSLSFKSILKSVFESNSHKKPFFMEDKFDRFFKNIVGDVQIEDLKIPYCAVGSNLLTGKIIAINKGSLITAMKASSAIPIIFKPVKIFNNYVFDGGMISPVPTEVVKQMGANIVMGVSLYGGVFPLNSKKQSNISRIKASKISRFLSLKKLADINLELADIAMELKIPHEDYSFFSRFLNNQELIDYGYQTTNVFIKDIKNKLNK